MLRGDGTTGSGVVWIDVAGGRISGVGHHPDGARGASEPYLHLGDRTIAAGYVDLHVHGGAGNQVNADSADEVERALSEIASFHARGGTTGLLATTVSDSPERLVAAVSGAAGAAARPRPGAARILGTHLEGPFISPSRAGAHPPSAIRAPDRAELNRLLEVGGGTVRLVTLAPELPGATELIADCLDAGAAVSLGHTDADYDAARRAIDAGATHVTHLFNAMAPLHHRRPGLVTAALLDAGVTVELVCDLHHVHPAVVDLVARSAPGRLVLVTDAGAAAGLPPGRHLLGDQEVEVEATRVSLVSDPATLAGSVLTMGKAVANAVDAGGLALDVALSAASRTPARVVGESRSRPMDPAVPGLGRLEAGAPADLVVLDASLVPVVTMVGGTVAWDPGGLLR